MPRPEELLRRVDRWMFAAEDGRRLASIRIGLCCVLALRLATTDYRSVAAQPAALFQPIWYMKLLGRMPSQGVAGGLQICGFVAALCAAAGLASRVNLSLALVCSLVLDGMLNSTGRVIVGDALLTLCLLILLAAGRAASDAWTVGDGRRRSGPGAGACPVDVPGTWDSARYGWPIRTAKVTIALSFFFAGFQKLRYSGLAWVTSDNLRLILYSSSDRYARPNAVALLVASRPWLAHGCAAATLLLELSFPLALFVRRARWALVVGVVAMHEFIRLALGLDYSAQALTVLVVFVDWPVVVAWLGSRLRRDTATASTLALSGPQN